MRFGEDIDFSIRIFQSSASCRLFPEAWVWHKRRTDLKKFFKQVHNSGIARINLWKRHPGSMKLVHMLPAVFTLGMAFLATICVAAAVFGAINFNNAKGAYGLCVALCSLIPGLLFSLLIFTDSLINNRSIKVAWLSIWASFIQLLGYGTGFIRAWWLRCVCSRNEELQAFKDNFYK